MPGFPIRTSSDQRSVDSSPRHIAASHVLHRLSMPRHPPCALKHLQTQNTKLQSEQETLLARCSQPLSTKQTPHPTTKMERQHHPPPPPGANNGPVASGPNSVPSTPRIGEHRPKHPPQQETSQLTFSFATKKYAPPATHYRHRHTYPNHHIPHDCGHGGKKVLLRKEVIQPHLPVRLPCYDFVPIADPTFDGSLHKG